MVFGTTNVTISQKLLHTEQFLMLLENVVYSKVMFEIVRHLYITAHAQQRETQVGS